MTAVTALTTALLLGLALGACETSFIDLVLPPDAGAGQPGKMNTPAPSKCELVKRSDGSECKICYAADGKVVDGACVPLMPNPPPVVDPSTLPTTLPTTLSCKVVPMADSRCLTCSGSAGASMVCLKCETPVKTGNTGEVCRACMWNDQMDRCLQCFAADGTVTHDDCDASRKETFPKTIVPPPK